MKIVASLFTDRTLVGSLEVGHKSYPVSAESHTTAQVYIGVYRLMLAIAVPSDSPLRAELGPKVLMFEEETTKRVVALHAGYTDARGAFLPTDGSLRVGFEHVCKIAGKAKKSTTPVVLAIVDSVATLTTKLIGARVGDAYVPPATLRQAVSSRRTKGDHWTWFAKHYPEFGCTLCKKW